jgi:glycosyltransferase involved in cell wall biosynthesis
VGQALTDLARPLLSLLIATRERAQTLAFTLASALNQKSADFEVIVSDNISQDETEAIVGRVNDERIRYFKTAHRLSMCGNYEFALEQARGKFVIFIGDDDAVMPNAIDKLIPLLRAGSEMTIYTWPLHIYDWPRATQSARIAHYARPVPRRDLSLKAKAISVMGMGGWKYYELPSPYHCAVPISILNSIRARTGRVFHSTQPDVFTAMAIPALADVSTNLNFTVTLNGRSAASNGLGFVSNNARRNIERFIQEYGEYEFHASLLPNAPAIAKMIPDAVLVARGLFPELYAASEFNYESMWAYICRLKFISIPFVLRNANQLKKYHSFNVAKFIAYVSIQSLAVVRRGVLNRFMLDGALRQPVPDDIYNFVLMLERVMSTSPIE